jgi:prepilin-type N-terminal cleavage/methylation domain-containing protein
MKSNFHNDSIDCRSGFSLLELIGVMAVTSILLAAAIPLTVNVIQNQRLADEKAALPALAEALKRGILREQAFPLYQNGVSRSQETGDDYYWWNLAARHGAGSANEARYPLGSRNTEGNVRKLYFADGSFADFSFSDLTGSGTGWLNDFQDPRELRLLLLSTTNPDLPLPDTISTNAFNKLWDEWAVGSDGEPLSGNWAAYGLSASQWENRAAELVVQRVDLREWLCEVRIENNRAIGMPNGTTISSLPWVSTSGTLNGDLLFNDNLDLKTPYVFTTNLVDCEVSLNTVTITEDTNTNGILDAGEDLDGDLQIDDIATAVTALKISDSGLVLDENVDPKITISGLKSGIPVSSVLNLTLTDRAPIALIDSKNSNTVSPLSGFGSTDPASQTRHFLLGQQLLLGEPWDSAEVGTFNIDKDFKSLRFDGQRWRY